MALTSRAQRERDQRKRMLRGKRNLSQLVGPQAQGQRTPMNRGSGYVNTVQAPKFQQSNPGADITQAGLAYKGGKGLKDFATGTEGGYNKAGVWVEGKEPWSLGDKTISERISQYGTDVGNRWGEATEGLFGGDSIPDASSFGVKPPPRGLLSPATPNINIGGYDAGTGDAEGMVDLSGKRIRGPNINDFGASTQLTNPNIAAQAATKAGQMSQLTAPGSFGGGGMGASSNLLSGAGAGSGLQGLGHLGSFGGGAEGIQGLGHLSGGSAGGLPSFGGSFGTVDPVSGSLSGGVDPSAAGSGLQGGGGQPWLAYANIGKDLIMGGPGSEKITGSTAGDAAIRAAAAYFTFGLSEIPYAFI